MNRLLTYTLTCSSCSSSRLRSDSTDLRSSRASSIRRLAWSGTGSELGLELGSGLGRVMVRSAAARLHQLEARKPAGVAVHQSLVGLRAARALRRLCRLRLG